MVFDFLFGKKRKCRDRRRKNCKPKKRYNVPGSPCNRLRKGTCKTTRGCTYVKRRGCRRAKGYAKLIVVGDVPEVKEQAAEAAQMAGERAADSGADIPAQAAAAGAAAADVAAQNVLAIGGTPKQAKEAAVNAAQMGALLLLEDKKTPPVQVQQIVNTLVETISSAPPPPPPPPPPKIPRAPPAPKIPRGPPAPLRPMGPSTADLLAGRERLRSRPPRVPLKRGGNELMDQLKNSLAARRAVINDDDENVSEFGRRRCDRRRRGCLPKKRFNVPGSKCNRKKRRPCMRKKGCSWVKRRGCRRKSTKGRKTRRKTTTRRKYTRRSSPFIPSFFPSSVPPPSSSSYVPPSSSTGPAGLGYIGSTGSSSTGSSGSSYVPPSSSTAPPGVLTPQLRQQALDEANTYASNEAAAKRASGANVLAVLQAAQNAGVARIKHFLNNENVTGYEVTKLMAYWKRNYSLSAFGRRRRKSRFGSVCTELLPKDQTVCMNYTDSNGMYPCTWEGGSNNRCKSRSIPRDYAYASTHGTYAHLIARRTPGLSSTPIPPTPPPVSPNIPPPKNATAAGSMTYTQLCKSMGMDQCKTTGGCAWLAGSLNRCQAESGYANLSIQDFPYKGPTRPTSPTSPSSRGSFIYDCTGRNEEMCGSNPNCLWQAGGNPPKCVRRKGHLQGEQYEGPMLPSGFGKKRRSTRRKGCKSKGRNKKLPSKLKKLCRKLKIKTTKKVGRRRVCKSIRVLMKQIAKKLKAMKKRKMAKRKTTRRRR